MSFYSKRNKLIFIPWAIAVCLLCTGSLINFHQHRIWGRPLLPQLVANKKDVEKTQTDIVLAKIRSDKDLTILHFNGDPAILILKYFNVFLLSFLSCKNELYARSYREFCIHSQGRRAPPLS